MGVHISPVQEFAVELMLVRDTRLRAQDFAERFKFAVISHNPGTWVAKMFPKWFPEPEAEVLDPLEIPDGPVEYVLDEEGLTPEKAREEFQRLIAQAGGRMRADELDDDEGWI